MDPRKHITAHQDQLGQQVEESDEVEEQRYEADYPSGAEGPMYYHTPEGTFVPLPSLTFQFPSLIALLATPRPPSTPTQPPPISTNGDDEVTPPPLPPSHHHKKLPPKHLHHSNLMPLFRCSEYGGDGVTITQ